MNEQDLNPDDEIVSSLLDGEATPEEARRVQRDPDLIARLEVFRAISAQVADTGPAPAPDDLITTAVAAADKGAEVIPMDRHRRLRPTTIASIAAAVLLVVLVGGAVVERWRGDDGQAKYLEVASTDADESRAAGAEVQDTEDGSAGAAPAQEGAVPELSEQATTTAPMGIGGDGMVATYPVELGSFATREEATAAVTAAIDDVVAALAENRATEMVPSPTEGTADAGDACIEAVTADDDELDSLVWSATFELPDGRHEVFLYGLLPGEATNGTHRLFELAGCELISETTLSP